MAGKVLLNPNLRAYAVVFAVFFLQMFIVARPVIIAIHGAGELIVPGLFQGSWNETAGGIAGLIEPGLTKILPILLLEMTALGIAISGCKENSIIDNISRPYLFGALCGLSAGVGELLRKMVVGDIVVEYHYPPVIFHVISGLVLVGLTVAHLQKGTSRRDIVLQLGPVLLGVMAIHFIWNVWFVDQPWFWDHYRELVID